MTCSVELVHGCKRVFEGDSAVRRVQIEHAYRVPSQSVETLLERRLDLGGLMVSSVSRIVLGVDTHVMQIQLGDKLLI